MLEETMKNVLVISSRFPPCGGTEVMRTLKFVKYLPSFNWCPIVLTMRKFDHDILDYALLKEIPEGVKVFRTRALNIPPLRSSIEYRLRSNTERRLEDKETGSVRSSGLSHLISKAISSPLSSKAKALIFDSIFIPDRYSTWIPNAVRTGVAISRKQKINLIYATGPFISRATYIVGCILSKVLNVPLIVDFRDLWIGHPGLASRYKYKHLKLIDSRIENFVISTSDKAITVTQLFTEIMRDRYPGEDRNKFVTITNGFDADDFKDVKGIYTRSNKFTISYVGSAMGIQTLRYFIDAIEELISEKDDLAQHLHLSFVGRINQEDGNRLQGEKLRKFVSYTTYRPHEEAIRAMAKSDVLLLIIYGGRFVLTSKIFEYIAVKRPILAIVPTDGEAARLITENNFGLVAPQYDIQEIKRVIYQLFTLWKGDKLKVNTDDDKIRQFERKELTRKLSMLFDEVWRFYSSKNKNH